MGKGVYIGQAPCEECGSKDNVSVYTDGSFCHGCRATTGSKKETVDTSVTKDLIYRDIPERKISKKTCEKYGYMQGEFNGQSAWVQIHRDKDGVPCAKKWRTVDKQFSWEGDSNSAVMFGQHLFAPNENISVTITEGAEDAMSIAEVQDCQWPIVSIKNGAGGAVTEFKRNLEWLRGFKEIRLCFDNDAAGQEAAKNVAVLFKPGFVKIITLPMKDASDMVKAGKIKELLESLQRAKMYRPDCIINSSSLDWEDIEKPQEDGWTTPYPHFNSLVGGIYKERLYLVAAGYGCGKSTFLKEIAFHLFKTYDLKIANIYLEESLRETVYGYMAIDNNIALGSLRKDPKEALGLEKYNESKKRLYEGGKFSFYKHFGADDVDALLGKIDFLATGEGADIVILDHITAAVSGMKGGHEGDRKTIDYLMDGLRSLIHRTGVTVLCAAQLVKPPSTMKSFNEGGQIGINDLRGSGQLGGIPDVVVGLEGNQQGDNPRDRTLRILKNRIGNGAVGLADDLTYDEEAGRLLPRQEVFFGVQEPTTPEEALVALFTYKDRPKNE